MATLLTLLLLLFSCLSDALSIPIVNSEIQLPPPLAKRGTTTYIGNTDITNQVEQFLGIRYAQPPTGSLRLKPPQRINNAGTVDATKFGNECFQMDGPSNVGKPPLNVSISEDCLFLNIYRPSEAAMEAHGNRYGMLPKGLPVMLWIHGGGFNDGSGDLYDGGSLVNTSVGLGSPIILVTINYRLSFFGFSAGNVAIANNSTNLGFLDQRQALQWVQENIAAWGGDPTKVTIFGQSAGATSIGLQMLAYNGTCQNLFRAAILESGSPQDTSPTPLATWPAYQKAWDSVIANISCTNSSDVFACVQNVSAAVLFKAVKNVGKTQAPLPSSTYPWQPVVDGTFLADFATKQLAAGKFVKIPTIVGFTTDEVTYVIPTSLNLSSDAILTTLAAIVLPFVPPATIAQMVALDPLSDFPNTAGVGGTQWKRATAIGSDLFEKCPGRAFIRNVTEYAPGWRYRFNAIIPAQLAQAPYQGIVHSAEIPYVFGPSLTPFVNETLDVSLSLTTQKAWIAFASYLDPNALGEIAPNVTWPAYNSRTEQVLVFQKPDGSAARAGNAGIEDARVGGYGVTGQGIHVERDPDDRPVCEFIIAHDADFVH